MFLNFGVYIEPYITVYDCFLKRCESLLGCIFDLLRYCIYYLLREVCARGKSDDGYRHDECDGYD